MDDLQKLRIWFEDAVADDQARFPDGKPTKQVEARAAMLCLLREAEKEIERLQAKWQKSEEWISELEETILAIKARAEKAEAERDEMREELERRCGQGGTVPEL